MRHGPGKVGGVIGRGPDGVWVAMGREEVGVTEDTCTRGLVGAARVSCPRENDESVEEGTKLGEGKDHGCDRHVNFPKVERESTTEQRKRNL